MGSEAGRLSTPDFLAAIRAVRDYHREQLDACIDESRRALASSMDTLRGSTGHREAPTTAAQGDDWVTAVSVQAQPLALANANHAQLHGNAHSNAVAPITSGLGASVSNSQWLVYFSAELSNISPHTPEAKIFRLANALHSFARNLAPEHAAAGMAASFAGFLLH